MTFLYGAIAALAAFGDAVKWAIPGEAALVFIYAAAALVLAGIVIRGRPQPLRRDAFVLVAAACILVLCYAIQALTAPSQYFTSAAKHAVYMAIPLLYIAVVARFWPEFDIARLAKVFLVMMLPINAIGIVQYFVNPTFMVLTTYAEDSAVILRNLAAGETFARYPSIFASADRYSSVALMQLYLTFALLLPRVAKSRKMWFFILANLLLSLVALFIAGARSRILIAGAEAALLAGCYLFVVATSSRLTPGHKIASFVALSSMLAVVALFWPAADERAQFPVLELLRNAGEGSGEIMGRIDDAIELSLWSENVTVFGEGLGVLSADGRPGEFGIMTMWVESGLFWGFIMLACFCAMIWILTKISATQILQRKPIEAIVCSFPVPMLVFALLAGLTSSFELSTGVLMACLIAWISQHRTGTAAARRPVPVDAVARVQLRRRTA